MSEILRPDERRTRDSEILAKRSLQVQRGGARAAVLGVNDGLVSTLSLVLTIAGAGASQRSILLAGVAGLIAGSISMAAGEWISVRSQVDLFKGVLRDVKQMIKADRQLLSDQLQANLIETGIEKATAAAAVSEINRTDEHLFELYASRVMGINPEELGSPWTAAISSFLLFTAGSLVPLIPWILGAGVNAIIASTALTALASLGVGAYIGISSGSGASRGGVRQLLIVVAAAIVTYGVGYLFGTTAVLG